MASALVAIRRNPFQILRAIIGKSLRFSLGRLFDLSNAMLLVPSFANSIFDCCPSNECGEAWNPGSLD
eukprot:2228634-Amphidinium_carterae.1